MVLKFNAAIYQKLTPKKRIQYLRKLVDSDNKFKELLKLAYDKNVLFQVRISANEFKKILESTNNNVERVDYDKVLKAIDYLMNLRPRQRKSFITDYLTKKLSKDEMYILLSVLRKTFNVGYEQVVKHILRGELQYYPFQLAEKLNYTKINNNSPVIVQLKLDGFRAIYNPVKKEFYTRNQEVLTLDKRPNLRFIVQEFDRLIEKNPELANYVFDGELFTKDWNTTSNIVSTEKHLSDDKVKQLRYYVFDIIPYDEYINYDFNDEKKVTDIPFIERNKLIVDLLGNINTEHIKFLKSREVNNYEELNKLLNKVIDKGYEGLMVKLPNEPYYDNRTYAWMKLKPENEIEAIIIDVIEGDGKHKDKVGAFVCKTIINEEEIIFRVGSGLTDEEREQYWKMKDELIGKIIDVKYQELTKDNIPRFPVFQRLRIDKDTPNFSS